MQIGRHKSLLAGFILGALAALLTWKMDILLTNGIIDHASVVRGLYALAQALIVPGALVAILIARGSNTFQLWRAAAINFLFWFGFVWLFGALLATLRAQWRMLRAQVRR